MTDRRATAARKPEERGTADELTRRLFHGLPRTDQRRWAGAYVTGLLTTPGRKSVRNMGLSLYDSHTAFQSLHQVVSESTWSWSAVRRELADWCRERTALHGWALGRVTVPKRGRCSAGVHRRFDPATGRTVGCQLGLGLFLLTERGALPVDWRLYLPDEWLDDPTLRRRARIPETARPGSPARLMLDLAAAADGSAAPVVAEAETVTEAAELVEGLGALGTDWILSVPGATPVSAGLHRLARTPAGRAPAGRALTAADLARQLQGSARPLGPATPEAPRLLPAQVHTAQSAAPLRMAASWAPGHRTPQRIWLTSLHGERLGEAAPLFTGHAVGTDALAGLDDCGLRDFEGRSYPGWHRHMTLVSAAYGHRLLEPARTRGTVPASTGRPAAELVGAGTSGAWAA
ncbi:putative ISXo8 transposase [Streptomyces mashuensis]|uniref:ISXo8 transposase n=1 Tax=Streptomyces mashuensis TaxID=33904 RepID=A0A919B9M2_9ACTN|nr:transposase [Streptomyces mashuensis]GHF71955.1 putative ISXo8 transposase [Streptomyces mashuensis]